MGPNFNKYPNERDGVSKLTFTDWDNNQLSINCPVCQCEFTHIDKVSVFSRREDETSHLETNIDLENKQINSTIVDGHGKNPSGRRNGLILHSYCEEGCVYDVEIYQHKGNTFINSCFKNKKDFSKD